MRFKKIGLESKIEGINIQESSLDTQEILQTSFIGDTIFITQTNTQGPILVV